MRMFLFRILIFSIPFISLSNLASAQFEYINPMPASKYHNPQTGIILRNGKVFSSSSIMQENVFKIFGSIGGEYLFDVKLVEDGKTILLTPKKYFAEGEKVTVIVNDGVKTIEGEMVTGISFDFNIREPRSTEINKRINDHMREACNSEFENVQRKSFEKSDFELPPSPLDGLPGFTILTNTGEAYAAQIFGHDFNLFNPDDSHFWIIENNGDSIYGKYDSVTFNNFQLNYNGYMTLYHRYDSSFVMLDSQYNQIAEFQMGNGYKADVHEFQIYADKKRFMIAYDPQIVDMTVYNPNYNPAATVIGLILQEIDSTDNVIFEWSSWDHIDILDANHIAFQNSIIDAVHCNSVEKDTDGNILISSRHLSEITKINRTTGDIIWRMGGTKNEFTFINDANQFTWQHDARRLANGNITIFDNGNFHVPPRSYAKEYMIDEINKTATLVWSYSRTYNNINMFSSAMGGVQRLPNGNTFIGWGLSYGNGFPAITEVDSLGNVVWELKFDNNSATCYRVRKHLWEPCKNLLDSNLFKSDSITAISALLSWDSDSKISEYILEYKKCSDSLWNSITSGTNSYEITSLESNTCYNWRIVSVCSFYGDTVYYQTQSFTTELGVGANSLLDSGMSIDVFPNPVSKNLNVVISVNRKELITVSILNLAGIKVFEQSSIAINGKNKLNIDLNNFTSGVYTIVVESEAVIDRKKVIIY